jgi:hypothetical protein
VERYQEKSAKERATSAVIVKKCNQSFVLNTDSLQFWLSKLTEPLQ